MLQHLLHRQARTHPDFGLVEAIAHEVERLDRELLALGALGVGEVRIVLAQSHAAEGDVPRLVLHDVGIHRGGEVVLGAVPDALEGGKRQPFDQHLHAEIGHIPAPVAQRLLEQVLERIGDRIGRLELLVDQPLVALDMAGLVHHLGGGIELGVHVRHGVDDLGRRDQRALLAVHELTDRMALQVEAQPVPLLLGHLVPEGRAVDRDGLVRHPHRVLLEQLLRPVDPCRGVPLLLLTLLVEIQQIGRAVLVFPVEGNLGGAIELPVRDLHGELINLLRRHWLLPPGALRGPIPRRSGKDDAPFIFRAEASTVC